MTKKQAAKILLLVNEQISESSKAFEETVDLIQSTNTDVALCADSCQCPVCVFGKELQADIEKEFGTNDPYELDPELALRELKRQQVATALRGDVMNALSKSAVNMMQQMGLASPLRDESQAISQALAEAFTNDDEPTN